MGETVNYLVVELFLKNPLFWIILLLGVISGIFYKTIIGKTGEHYVKKELKKLDNRYLVINDLLLKTKDGKTHQIDHVVISEYGIFVIETKQYSGYIAGNDFSKQWVVNGRYKIHNPVHQNYGHAMAISELTGIDEKEIIQIVCFSSNAKLNIKSRHVVKISQLLQKIVSHDQSKIQNHVEIYNKLSNANLTDKKSRKNHVNSIKQKG